MFVLYLSVSLPYTVCMYMLVLVYLADPAVPAHTAQSCCSQDDGSKVLLLIQLLQSSVQVPSLEGRFKDQIKCTLQGSTSKTRSVQMIQCRDQSCVSSEKDTMSLNSRWGNLFFSWAALRRELVPITL